MTDYPRGPCPRCGGQQRNGQVCTSLLGWSGSRPLLCGYRPPCPACGAKVGGKVTAVYCSDRCRKAHHRATAVPDRDAVLRFLVAAPDHDLREVLGDAMRRRAPVEQRRGRLRVRWRR